MSRNTLVIHIIFILLFVSNMSIGTIPLYAQAVEDRMDRPSFRMDEGKAGTTLLLDVTFAGKRLVAVGERGIVILSDDNGRNWRQAETPVSVTLTAVQFVTHSKGWAVGHAGIVLHSKDGGETWQKQLDGYQAALLALDAARAGLERGDGDPDALKRRVDAAQLLLDDGPDKPFLDLYFEDEQRGFIVGAYNLIYYTEDGGRGWEPWQAHVENPMALHLYGIQRVGKDLYIVGEQGLFLRSADGGETYDVVPTPYEGTYMGLLDLGKGNILLFGLRGHAFLSEDRGSTWHKIKTGVALSITGGTILDNGTVMLVTQAGTLLASCDNGHTFEKASIGKASPFEDVVQDMDGNLVIVGMGGVMRFAQSDLKICTPAMTGIGGDQ